jgi:hypothetical protein
MSSYESLHSRLTALTRQLNQKDTELDQQVGETIQADLDELDKNTEAAEKDLRDGLRQRVEAVKKGIKDKKDELRQKIEAAKKAPKDHASKEAEHALKRMEEDLSNEDLVSAHIDRWTANQWLKASK